MPPKSQAANTNDPKHLINATVFYFNPRLAWELAQVVSVHFEERMRAHIAAVKDSEGNRHEIEIKPSKLHLPTPGIEKQKPDNLLTLSELHHSVLLNALRLRHKEDVVYTFLGELVLAINPYKFTIPHYQPERMEAYLSHPTPELPSELKPHSWSVAHRSYVEMRRNGNNHSVVISGESGSGKTESCKIMLQYLCEISARSCNDEKTKQRSVAISKKVQDSSPVLEAFGNAKTARNDNSSRFGKFIEVQFTREGILCGMKVTPYLLEKSRVVTCGPQERVYHCFYQLVAGASDELRDALRLGKSAKEYRTLMVGGAPVVQGVNDAEDFGRLTSALETVGFSSDEQRIVWQVLAAILHLGNVVFGELRKDNRATLDGPDEVTCRFVATDLLRLSSGDDFVKCMTSAISIVGKETVTRHLSKQKAEDQRDSICKHLFSNLFHWIISKINQSTAPTDGDTTSSWIGLLDIFGFEDFQNHNSFEQLCINLANERLQRHYTRHIFLKDMEEIKQEGIKAESVNYQDNQPCLDLIAGPKHSVISMLDDASMLDFERSNTNPNFTFLYKLTMQHKPDFERVGSTKGGKSVLERGDALTKPSDFFHRGKLDDDTFTIRHYAADVKYKIHGFVEKNTDQLNPFAQATLSASNDDTVVKVMSAEATADELAASGFGSAAGMASPTSPGSPGRGRGMRRTVGNQFRDSLENLMAMIDSTVPNWVRCVRPHPSKRPNMWDNRGVLEQLVATGVLETIEQRQRNFPFRVPFFDFISRFAVLAFRTLKKMGDRLSMQEKCNTIVGSAHGISAADLQVGKSKVFMRTAARTQLEAARAEKINSFVVTCSVFLRMRDSRHTHQFLRFRAAAIACQRCVRLYAKIRRCVREYYRELWVRIEKQFHDQRRQIEHAEDIGRNKDLQSEATERLEIRRAFMRNMGPLIAGVLRNVLMVEAKKRLAIEEVEFEEFDRLRSLSVDSVRDAERATVERLRRELEERQHQRDAVLAAYLRHRMALSDNEQEARRSLLAAMAPELERLRNKAARIRELQVKRDQHLLQLLKARDREERRLELEQHRHVADEREVWNTYVGQETVREDARHLAKLGLSSRQAVKHMDIFCGNGTPTNVVTSGTVDAMSPCSPTKSSPSGGPTTPVRSYRDYTAAWQAAHQSAVATKGGAAASPSKDPRHAQSADDLLRQNTRIRMQELGLVDRPSLCTWKKKSGEDHRHPVPDAKHHSPPPMRPHHHGHSATADHHSHHRMPRGSFSGRLLHPEHSAGFDVETADSAQLESSFAHQHQQQQAGGTGVVIHPHVYDPEYQASVQDYYGFRVGRM